MAEPTHAAPPDTAANVRELRATIVALRRLLSIGSLDDALPAASRIPALKLTTDALAVLGRFLEGTHSIQDAAGALACKLLCVDESGAPLQFAEPTPLRQMTTSFEAFARAVVDAAVERATLAAPRVTSCTMCGHLSQERGDFLHEIEGLRLENEALQGQLRAVAKPAPSPRWAAALERVAQRYESDGRPVVAASVRRAIELGVSSEHDARLVLATLGWSNPDAVERALFGEDEGASNDVR